MKHPRWTALALVLPLCLGTALAADTPADPAVPPAPEAKPLDTTPRLAKGLMMKQADKLVFAPCRDRSYHIVEDLSPNSAVVGALDQVGLAQGERLYVELMGYVEGIALKVSKLNFAQAKGRCQMPADGEAWRASGTDWSLVAGGEHLLIKTKGRDDARLTFGAGEWQDGSFHYASDQVQLRFTPGLCRQAGEAVVFGWTASVTVNGQTHEGCAWQQ